MASTTSGTAPQPCPDPSAHHSSHKLSEQASTAALYATHPDRGHDSQEHVLGNDGKLSSKSAAASLKYAKPQDLPSFPSHGIDTANSAGHAAMLAKDYRMKELWQPTLSAAGSKAALLAHKDGGKLDLWQPSASADGNSAAKLAMKNKTLSPQIDYGYTKDGRSNALLAATKSQRAVRQRAGSTPVPRVAAYPDSANSAYNALNAATISHRAATKPHNPRDPDGWDSAAMQAARIQNIGDRMDPEMFTEKPPVELEKQEKRDQAALRASAISMAKQMYEVQHRVALGDSASPPALDGKQFAAHVASPPTDIKQEAMKYIHLQDAAHKLAQERLAKVDKNFEARRYREYYGYDNSPRSRLSTRSFARKRASSETAKDEYDDSDDEEQARRVRTQMSQFNTALASVDSKKQQADRDQLLAIAQKRVQKSMHDMDEKVFQDTGKVSQAMMDEWEAKAKKRVTEDAERRDANRGKTHIGAGKYMDTAEIEAIAQARLRPTFDEINEVAEKRRARDAEIKLDKAEQERQKQMEKQREKEHKEIAKRTKQEQKAVTKKEREDRKADEAEEQGQSNRRSIFGLLSIRHKDRDAKKETSAAEATTVATADKTVVEADDTVTTPPITTTTNTIPSHSPPVDAVTEPKASTATDRSIAASPAKATTAKDSSLSPNALQTSDDTASLSNDNKQPKGVKGLFAKLRPKRSKNDVDDDEVKGSSFEHGKGVIVASDARADKQSKDPEPASTPIVAAGVTEPPSLPEHVGTDGVIGDSSHVSGIGGDPGAASPSSFRRRDAEGNDADISSLSSSGLEEDDLHEGRTGRVARALGLGKLRSKHKADETPKKPAEEDTPVVAAAEPKAEKDDDDDDDTFEEARDTIDPASAPEPAFVGQKATAQHGRETKFQEEL